jgi:hypothetical protein
LFLSWRAIAAATASVCGSSVVASAAVSISKKVENKLS